MMAMVDYQQHTATVEVNSYTKAGLAPLITL